MEDPPDLSSLFQSASRDEGTCTSSNQVGRYHDPALGQGYCHKEREMALHSEWASATWDFVKEWIKSELSLNLYQYHNGNSSLAIDL